MSSFVFQPYQRTIISERYTNFHSSIICASIPLLVDFPSEFIDTDILELTIPSPAFTSSKSQSEIYWLLLLSCNSSKLPCEDSLSSLFGFQINCLRYLLLQSMDSVTARLQALRSQTFLPLSYISARA